MKTRYALIEMIFAPVLFLNVKFGSGRSLILIDWISRWTIAQLAIFAYEIALSAGTLKSYCSL
jgi:hypothetical protein